MKYTLSSELYIIINILRPRLKMDGLRVEGSNYSVKSIKDDAEDVEKVLSVVVKRRKTIPKKYMELFKENATYELLRLENAKVVIDENSEKENFKKIVQGLRKLKFFQFSLDDLHKAEMKLEKYSNRTKEINSYLEKRRTHLKENSKRLMTTPHRE